MGTLSSRPKGDPGTLPIFRICYFCQITPVVFIFVTDGQQTKCNKFEEEKACLHHQINYSDSCCEQLQLQLAKLQTDLTVSQSSPEEITAEKQQKDEDLETLQDEINSALSRQTVLEKKMRRLKAVSNSALKKLEEEKDQLTNQVTEVQTLR